jgi:predicted alpha/beta-hydrolase family hydrolase
MRTVDIDTPHGPARAHVDRATASRGALVLGHGAGGGVSSRDLQTARDVALSEGLDVVLVEQPYRAAGRRSPAPPAQLDAAWTAVLESLRHRELGGLPLVVGGRSSGARVACRTAAATGAVGVLCLAFPLQPPRRASASSAPPSRLPELDEVTVPTLVVQGARDRFGVPPPRPNRTVALVSSDHGLRSDLAGVADAIRGWLPTVLS